MQIKSQCARSLPMMSHSDTRVVGTCDATTLYESRVSIVLVLKLQFLMFAPIPRVAAHTCCATSDQDGPQCTSFALRV